MKYVFSAGKSFNKEDIIEIIKEVKRVYPEGSDLVVTTAERLREELLWQIQNQYR